MTSYVSHAWVREGWGFKIENRDQLIRTIGRIATLKHGRTYAWRGQADANWELSSHLYRDTALAGAVSGPLMREREKRIVREARNYGLGRELGLANTDAHVLASLQHHGVPSRLIDVTTNPFTALWFACQRPGGRSVAGVLFAIDVTDMPWYRTSAPERTTYDSVSNPFEASYAHMLNKSLATRTSFRLFPAMPDERMKAQEGYFIGAVMPDAPLIPHVPDLVWPNVAAPGADSLRRLVVNREWGGGRPFALPFLALVIPPSVKTALADPLKGTFNRRRRVLFPDVDGFREAVEGGEADLDTPALLYDFDAVDGAEGNAALLEAIAASS